MPRPRQAGSAFRLRAKNVFLTYPRYAVVERPDAAAVKLDLLALGGNKGVPEQCTGGVIAIETHEDGAYHIHALLMYAQHTECRDATCFDINGKHGNYQAASSVKRVRNYVRKHGDYIEWGEALLPCDRPEILQKVAAGQMTLPEAVAQVPGLLVGYKRLKLDLATLLEDRRPLVLWRALKVYWLYGPAGLGKSRWAASAHPQAYRFPRTGRFFDGYLGEETLILDDYRADMFKYHELLSILDGYPLRVEVKGGTAMANWTTVVITSDKHPKDIYTHNWDEQLKRRITKMVNWANQMEVYLFINPGLDLAIDPLFDSPPPAVPDASPIGAHWD